MKLSIAQVCCAAALLMSPYAPAMSSPQFDEAIASAQDGDYVSAARRMRGAAGEGDPRAQEVLGFMLIWGERLYGAAVPQDVSEDMQWLKRAAENGGARPGAPTDTQATEGIP